MANVTATSVSQIVCFFQWLKEQNVSYNNAIDVFSLSEMQSATSQFSGLKRKRK